MRQNPLKVDSSPRGIEPPTLKMDGTAFAAPRDMLIILVCVFGVSVSSTGDEFRDVIHVDRKTFRLLRNEEGHELKAQLCEQKYGQKPDLVWLESAETPAQNLL